MTYFLVFQRLSPDQVNSSSLPVNSVHFPPFQRSSAKFISHYVCSEKHYSRITQHFGSPRCRNPQGEEPTLGSSAASPALKFLSGAPATPAGCLQRTPSTAWSSDGVTPSSVQAPVKTFLFLSPNQQFFLLSSGIQYCTHKWLCWRAAYRYL